MESAIRAYRLILGSVATCRVASICLHVCLYSKSSLLAEDHATGQPYAAQVLGAVFIEPRILSFLVEQHLSADVNVWLDSVATLDMARLDVLEGFPA